MKKKLPVVSAMVSVSQVLTKSHLNSTWVVYTNSFNMIILKQTQMHKYLV